MNCLASREICSPVSSLRVQALEAHLTPLPARVTRLPEAHWQPRIFPGPDRRLGSLRCGMGASSNYRRHKSRLGQVIELRGIIPSLAIILMINLHLDSIDCLEGIALPPIFKSTGSAIIAILYHPLPSVCQSRPIVREPLGNEPQKSTQSCNLLEMNDSQRF